MLAVHVLRSKSMTVVTRRHEALSGGVCYFDSRAPSGVVAKTWA